MSRHDARRALQLRLPDDLRRALVARVPDRRPLPGLVRAALCRALMTPPRSIVIVAPGQVRPLLLQLAPPERAALEAEAARRGLDPEVAAISLVAATL